MRLDRSDSLPMLTIMVVTGPESDLLAALGIQGTMARGHTGILGCRQGQPRWRLVTRLGAEWPKRHVLAMRQPSPGVRCVSPGAARVARSIVGVTPGRFRTPARIY